MKNLTKKIAATAVMIIMSFGQITTFAYYDSTDSFYWTDTSTKCYNIINNNNKKIGVQKLTSSSGTNIDDTMKAAKASVKNYRYNSSTKRYDKYGWSNSTECYARAKIIRKTALKGNKTLVDTGRKYGKYNPIANTAKTKPNVFGSAYAYCGYSGK